MSLRSRQIAKELISQQMDPFAAKLTYFFTEFYKFETPKEAQESPLMQRFTDAVFKRLGLKVKTLLDTKNPPACMPLLGGQSHSLSSKTFPKALADLVFGDQAKSFEDKVRSIKKPGIVDLKNAKVSGLYQEFELECWMSLNFCKEYLTPAECTAVFLHEMGHCFLAFEFMFRSLRASQVMASLHQVRTGRDNSLTYEHAIEIAGEVLSQDKNSLKSIIELKDDRAIATVIFSQGYEALVSDFGEGSVTGPNFEVLADNFSAKFGVAEDLYIALTKIMGVVDGYNPRNRFVATAIYILTIFHGLAVGGIIALLFFPAPLFIAVFAVLLLLPLSFDAGRGDTKGGWSQQNVYDTPLVRLARIRETVVEQLKSRELDAKTQKQLLEQVKRMDEVLKNKQEYNSFLQDMSSIWTKNRRADFAFKLERDIETLAHNDLFVSAAKLKQI